MREYTENDVCASLKAMANGLPREKPPSDTEYHVQPSSTAHKARNRVVSHLNSFRDSL